VECTLWLL